MTVINKIKTLFRLSVSANPEPSLPLETAPDSRPEPALLPTQSIPVSPLPILSADPNEEPAPDWLTDLDLLRDEGVLYGLSESRPEEKILSIRHYFQRQTAPYERTVEQHNEHIGELNLFIGEREQRINELKAKIAELENQKPEGEHQLPRTIAGLLLSGLMCTGTYYLIEETLQPFFQASRMISIGVFLAGMFSLFGRISVFHDANTRLTLRRLLEEAALPLAASMFVFVKAMGSQPLGQAVALFVFLFFLFLLGGKLLLGTLTVLRNDLKYLTASRELKEQKRARPVEWEKDITRLTAEIEAFRVQKWQVIAELTRTEAELHGLYARRDMLINIFESEYSLASSLRNRLSDSQRRLIQGE